MSPLIWITILAGVAASFACFKAARDAGIRKRAAGQTAFAVQSYWAVIAAYMSFFTILRFAHWLDLGWEKPLFYAQTIAGACTIIALSYIFIAVWKGQNAGRWGAEAALMAAFVTVFLIFFYGVEGPIVDDWGVELLPNLLLARIIVGALYLVMPMAMGILIVIASRHESPEFKRQKMFFGVGMFLIYAPNAVRYVVVTSGTLGAALAIIMAIGCVIGLQSHRNPVGNA